MQANKQTNTELHKLEKLEAVCKIQKSTVEIIDTEHAGGENIMNKIHSLNYASQNKRNKEKAHCIILMVMKSI